MANRNCATYSAPVTVPSRNPVSISAELDIPGKGKAYLVSNVTVVGEEFIEIKTGAGPGSGTISLVRSPLAVYNASTNITTLSAYEETNSNENSRRVEINFKGTIADSLGWNYKTNIELSYIVRVNGENTVYNSWWSDGRGWHDSEGGVYISSYGKKGEYITGTFVAGKSGYTIDRLERTTVISGKIKIKRN